MEGYAMEEDTVVGLARPGGTVEDDPLLAVLREGARQMLSFAFEAEVQVPLDRDPLVVREDLTGEPGSPRPIEQLGVRARRDRCAARIPWVSFFTGVR